MATTKIHRRDLKQDEIRNKFLETIQNASLHGREVIYIITVVVAVLFIAIAWRMYETKQQEQSQSLLGQALEKMSAPVGEQPPAQPGQVEPRYKYKTEQEKYSAAMKDFENISKRYGNTPAAEASRYQAGVCAFYLNDNAKAEKLLTESSRVSDRNVLYYLSRMALADLYASTGKHDQAIKVLAEARDHDKKVIPTENILLQLGEAYRKAGKNKEAEATYQQIVDKYKESPVSYQAQQKLSELKGTPAPQL